MGHSAAVRRVARGSIPLLAPLLPTAAVQATERTFYFALFFFVLCCSPQRSGYRAVDGRPWLTRNYRSQSTACPRSHGQRATAMPDRVGAGTAANWLK